MAYAKPTPAVAAKTNVTSQMPQPTSTVAAAGHARDRPHGRHHEGNQISGHTNGQEEASGHIARIRDQIGLCAE